MLISFFCVRFLQLDSPPPVSVSGSVVTLSAMQIQTFLLTF
jgi:hypothetical protein